MKKKSSRVSLADVARAAGISNMAVSFALRNRPGVSPTTRARVLRVARKMGYSPDARLSSWMTKVRETQAKDLLPIAWLNNHTEKDAWQKHQFLAPYLEGARSRCHELGYRLEEIWTMQPGMTMKRVSQILCERGIEGVIVNHFQNHIRLNWDHMAGVSLEGGLLAPRIHRVMADYYFNLLLALKVLKRAGYRRIGICLDRIIGSQTNHAIDAAAYYLHSKTAKTDRIPPLFHASGGNDNWRVAEKQILPWLRRYRPDVVVGHHNHLVNWVEEAGYRVPHEVGVVHLATEDDVNDWAGIHSNKRNIGAAAVALVVSLMQNNEFGVPKIATNTSVRGSWHPGRTLLLPKRN